MSTPTSAALTNRVLWWVQVPMHAPMRLHVPSNRKPVMFVYQRSGSLKAPTIVSTTFYYMHVKRCPRSVEPFDPRLPSLSSSSKSRSPSEYFTLLLTFATNHRSSVSCGAVPSRSKQTEMGGEGDFNHLTGRFHLFRYAFDAAVPLLDHRHITKPTLFMPNTIPSIHSALHVHASF